MTALTVEVGATLDLAPLAAQFRDVADRLDPQPAPDIGALTAAVVTELAQAREVAREAVGLLGLTLNAYRPHNGATYTMLEGVEHVSTGWVPQGLIDSLRQDYNRLDAIVDQFPQEPVAFGGTL